MSSRFRSAGFLVFALLAVSLAGCADEPVANTGVDENEPPEVQSTSTTGGIRGVIVDQAIVPVADAKVVLKETGAELMTGADGVFVFNGLDPGFYTLEASKPLHDKIQATTEVKANVANPDAVRIQLTRLTNQDPYAPTLTFNGYIFCSANIVIALSEECGEGVGVPGAGRIGANPDNNAQIDFNIDSNQAKTIMAEVVWEPSLSLAAGGQGGGFNMGIYTFFSCDPFCGWDTALDRKDSKSPMYLRSGAEADLSMYSEETPFSTFTWAASDETGVLLEQPFKVYQTTSYLLPLPEGWSFVNGDANPF